MADVSLVKEGSFTGTTIAGGVITSSIPLTTKVISAYNKTANDVWLIVPSVTAGDNNWRFVVFGSESGYMKPRASGQTYEIGYYYME